MDISYTVIPWYNIRKSITSVVIENGVTSIAEGAFYESGLKNVTIPDSVTSIGKSAFSDCIRLTSITIPDSITSINRLTFSNCSSLKTITIPNSVTRIFSGAFGGCNRLGSIYYNGSPTDWDKIDVDSNNNSELENATKEYFYYVTFLDVDGKEINKITYDINTVINISDIEERTGYTPHLYTDEECQNEFGLATPITYNIELQLRYIINQYTYRFLDEDGTVLKEETVDYGTVITPPQNPSKESTAHYTYTFAGWDGYTVGMTLSDNISFTATYDATVNLYTYKFLDEDGTVLKEKTVDYGTVITPPETSDKTIYYLFDYWQNYTEGMTLTEDITFAAVYKYKDYSIMAEGLPYPTTVTYNGDYNIDTQTPEDGYNFIGYFTEPGGKGTKITDENGESINVYNTAGNLNVYPYFESRYLNKIELQGDTSVMPGGQIAQRAVFATDKDAAYLTATLKYPKYLNFKGIKAVDFSEAVIESEKTEGEYQYLEISCIYDYEGNNMPLNTNLIPFETEFDILKTSPIGNTEVYIEKVALLGDSDCEIALTTNHIFEILESIEIIGQSEIDRAAQYTAVVLPDYTSDKSVVWSVDDEGVATVAQDGVLTPVKNGTVTLTATAKDGSGVFATKVIKVIAYAKITGLAFDGIDSQVEFDADVREYTVYVTRDKSEISLTPTFSEGVLRPNGSGLWISGRSKEFSLNESGSTVITLNIENVTGMTDSVYTVRVIKIGEIEAIISEDGKDFRIDPGTEIGNTVILALYNGDMLADIQYAVYNDNELLFTSNKEYTTAKVMVWSGFGNLQPVCKAEPIE